MAKKLAVSDGIDRDRAAAALASDSVETVGGSRAAWLEGDTGTAAGCALVSPGTTNPIFVSAGHGVALRTAVRLVDSMCRHRVPEPVRQARGVIRSPRPPARLRGARSGPTQ